MVKVELNLEELEKLANTDYKVFVEALQDHRAQNYQQNSSAGIVKGELGIVTKIKTGYFGIEGVSVLWKSYPWYRVVGDYDRSHVDLMSLKIIRLKNNTNQLKLFKE